MDEVAFEKMHFDAIGNKDTRATGVRNRDQDTRQTNRASVVVRN
jgi:hypothetical protein